MDCNCEHGCQVCTNLIGTDMSTLDKDGFIEGSTDKVTYTETPDENCETCFGNTHFCPDCKPESLTCSTCVDGKEFNATYGCGAAEALGWEPCCE